VWLYKRLFLPLEFFILFYQVPITECKTVVVKLKSLGSLGSSSNIYFPDISREKKSYLKNKNKMVKKYFLSNTVQNIYNIYIDSCS